MTQSISSSPTTQFNSVSDLDRLSLDRLDQFDSASDIGAAAQGSNQAEGLSTEDMMQMNVWSSGQRMLDSKAANLTQHADSASAAKHIASLLIIRG